MRLTVILLLLGAVQTIYAQTITPKWNIDEEKEKMIITYNLPRSNNDIPAFYNVNLIVKIGEEEVETKTFAKKSDVGNWIKEGEGLEIEWLLYEDIIDDDLDLLIVEIEATRKESGDPPPRKPILEAVIAGAGAGLVTYSAIEFFNIESENEDLIGGYQAENVYSTDPDYRGEYDVLNDKYRQNQYIMIGAGTLIVVGGALLLLQNKKIKQWKQTGNISITPLVQPDFSGRKNTKMGVGLAYRF